MAKVAKHIINEWWQERANQAGSHGKAYGEHKTAKLWEQM